MAYSLQHFAAFCSRLMLDVGRPLKLQPFQRKMLREFFGGAVETVIIIPKKNGKTTLLGALALYHVTYVPEAECVIGAASRDQATILFNQAAGLIRRSGTPQAKGKSVYVLNKVEYELRSGTREIRCNGGRIRVLPADVTTIDGVIPTLALVDELHRHPSAELYGVFRDGLGPRNGQMITISTAGWTPESPLGQLRKLAHDLEGFTREGAYNHAASKAGSFVLHEWCLENTDDLGDMKLVKTANPAPWHTIRALRQRYDSPSTTPAQWARFACGVWTFGEEPWIAPADWDGMKVDIGRVEPGEEVWVAVEGGAVAIVAQRDTEAIAATAQYVPNTFADVEAAVWRVHERYQVREVCYDRVGFQRSAELLAERGIPMLEVPHSPERLSMASATLNRLVEGGLLRHDGNPELRADVLRGTTKETERGWRFVKSVNTSGLIALAVACHQATSAAARGQVGGIQWL